MPGVCGAALLIRGVGLTLQAQQNWGKGCTVLDRLTRETLRESLANGKVVIFAMHGKDGYAETCQKGD